MMLWTTTLQIAEVKRPWYNRESGEKSISEEMLSAGWAHVYVQSNAVYGDAGHNKTNKQNFLKLEAQAKYAFTFLIEI